MTFQQEKRWIINCKPLPQQQNVVQQQNEESLPQESSKEEKTDEQIPQESQFKMNNYFSIGNLIYKKFKNQKMKLI